MQGVSFWFFVTAATYALAGMVWGVVMAASGDHGLAAAHAHLNLVGWASMGLFGVYYHLVPVSAERRLAWIHLAVATVGLLVLVPGIVLAIRETTESFAEVGAVLTIVSMAIFVATVIRDRVRQPATARARLA